MNSNFLLLYPSEYGWNRLNPLMVNTATKIIICLFLFENYFRNHSSSWVVELLPPIVSKAKPPLTLVGDVHNKIAIIIDDIIDDVSKFITAADFLSDRGAYKVSFFYKYFISRSTLLQHMVF